MSNNGWVKHFRKEAEWANELTDQQCRYLYAARLAADWDRRHKTFGTFDARTLEVKKNMLPKWSTGKINTVKNELLNMGCLVETSDVRLLRIQNARLFLSRSKIFEDVIQQSESNLHKTEYDFQRAETQQREIGHMRADLVSKKTIKSTPDPSR